ncbi:dentin sialophosphoprotein-related [Striga hermonthica]|uniref:Dentin sialophosphoprotein-related n=1 Tax=Striga hermonthica TaxID=68872 RepID=A0A9N7MXJ5_STRHE|nr:dentin sialophosphoprotein-related [Striga hermonthica]
MSDLCLYELEDLVWDDFCQSDDHIVPYPGSGRTADHSILSDSHNKPCSEVTSSSNSTRDESSIRNVNMGIDQGGFPSLNKRTYTMLENDSWCNTTSGVSPSSPESNSIREASSVASENTTSSRHASKSNKTDWNNNEICTNDTILSKKSTAVDNSSFGEALGDITHTGSNLDFFENTENKDSSELLYYGWPEIGNFEDVDRMFRSCDSTFGLGASKEDELGWFGSADNIGGSGDTVKSEFEFPYPEPNPVEYTSQNDSSKSDFINDISIGEDCSWTSKKSDSFTSLVNEPVMANSKDRFISKEQINNDKNQVKLQVQSTGKRKEHCFGNGTFNCTIDLHDEPMRLPLSYMHSNNSPDLTSVNLAPSAIKSEIHGLKSPSLRDPSYASIQLQNDPKFPVAGKREKLQNDPGVVSLGIPAEMGPSLIQEYSTMSSGVDDVSPEAASFRQLQLVMEQLDLRTKICIRDSLYRLAQSAEQRHNHANLNGSCAVEIDAGGAFFATGTNDFMSIETDTNPIDRSIAHLLFHRPSEPSNTVHGSSTSPPVTVENLLTCEENASKIEKATNCKLQKSREEVS